MDIVIRGAEIADGTGSPRFRAEVGVKDGRIAAVGSDRLDGARVIDAGGLVLSPGFIDMHAHSELAVLADREHLAKLGQGCTLEVLGQDGLSYAPVDETTAPQMWEAIAAWNGKLDVDYDWRSVGEYLDRLDRGIPTNAAYLVPHGTVRMAAMGWEHRRPTGAELDAMKAAVARGMEEGAFGLSAGLSYTPGMYADTAELVELCTVVAQFGGYFSPHQRSYGAGAMEGYAEMIQICREAGCALHLAHATLNYEVNQGRAAELLKLVDEGLDEGVPISLDTYPYLPGMTMLAALLPSWSLAGGYAALRERLGDAETRARIVHELDVVGTDGANGVPVDWSRIEIAGVAKPELRGLVGERVAAAAGAQRPSEFFLDLIARDDFDTACLMHVGNEENVRAIMQHGVHTGSSDGVLAGEKIHPRAWGSFARYLGHYTRELGLLSVEECVAHLSGRPAAVLGLHDRGLVQEGCAADLVLFDPATVDAKATFERPRQQAAGVPYVMVNGALAIDDGCRTEALAGRSVRRPVLGR
ncbi:D-aminoacylase [Glycomyces sp. TRM65418]|uniref:N-acyl-D-amino-acid deacylase family protein n=1 Tax=Glycomyces sp. TRM65418 TaxID=2867006 RepID=UPI001CE65B8B|nr:D-aminoacylase [Glycomyces sp. TRM65418]MCC3762958.1 D-aminoacylase [Glycomyces sp. TRM65418]QZD57790.1 D-aminoacylase [Glycomyces sp. TRM65418]